MADVEAKEPEGNSSKIRERLIEEEMKESFLDYSMSVIVSRALPDVRDGLKPVHRRILYAMHDMGMFHNKPFKKSARIVGECLGKYHPHGDIAVYDSLVRMAQPFSLRYPLIDGQGNFGSIDGDSAAAMRYTEARLKQIAEQMLADINKDTVNFMPNFDGSLQEPEVLPSKIPNLLINGSTGIAVGMATNIPPHNLTEVCDAITKLIDNPETKIIELLNIVKGPDFPTGGIICGKKGVQYTYASGKGKIIVKARSEIEKVKDREQIIVTEIPFLVNKTLLIEQIVSLVKSGYIADIQDIRDESSKKGMRIVIVLKKDADSNVVLNQLMKHTRLRMSFGANMLALVNKEPKILNLKELLTLFIQHRKEVITRRTKYDLKVAEDKAHKLEGLKVALDNIDDVVKLIKESKSADSAMQSLVSRFNLSKVQAQSVLEMRLQRLTSLEQDKIKADLKETLQLIDKLKEILADEKKIYSIIKEETVEIKEKYGDERRTEIVEEEEEEFAVEDLIEEENMAITITHSGYVKRIPLNTYRAQRRGGKGIIGTGTREEDFVEELFVASTHAYLLIFTNKGKVHWLKVYEIPEASRQAKGRPIVNLVEGLEPNEKVTAVVPVRKFKPGRFLLAATKNGIVKKTSLEAYSRPRRGGIIAINLLPNDELVSVELTNGNREILLATKDGWAVKFHEKDAREIGRTGKGVRGIKLRKDDSVVGMVIADRKDILTVTEKGYGKRTNSEQYRKTRRGGKGVINIKITPKNGKVVCVDIQEKMINLLEKRSRKADLSDRIETRICQGDSLGLGDFKEQIDFALASAVVHEVPDASNFFSQIYETIKPTERFLVAEPKGHVSQKDFDLTVSVAEKNVFCVIDSPQIGRSRVILLAKKT